MNNSLLARFADDTFWLARYVERADSLARLLEVTETHVRDEHGAQDWAAMLDINGDLPAFKKAYGKPEAAAVIRFYTIDGDNPSSIRTAIAFARNNARSLRHLISTEMWTEINMFHSWLGGLRRRDVQPRHLPAVCASIKERCQAHTGITEATFYRDQAWSFYWIGKMVERADQASRLLDLGFLRAERSGTRLDEHGEHLSQLTALLRSVGGYHAFRRTHAIRMRPHDVAAFILQDSEFPRSMLGSVEQAYTHMLTLIDNHGVETAKPALGLLNDLRSVLAAADTPTVLERGLHGFADGLQRRLIGVTEALGQGCFGYETS